MADDVDRLSAWNWGEPFAAAALGVIQISAGVVLQASCRIPGVGILLIRQGSCDIMFAIRTGLANTFSWSEYVIQKLISLPFTVACISIVRWLYGGAENVLRRSVAEVVARHVAMVSARGVATVCFDRVLTMAKEALLSRLRERIEAATENVFAQNFVDLGDSVEDVFRSNPADADRLVSEAFADVASRFDEQQESVSDRIRSTAVEFLPALLVELGLEFLAKRAGQDFGDRTMDSAKFATLWTISVAECCIFARNFLTSLREALETIVVINVHKLFLKLFLYINAFLTFFLIFPTFLRATAGTAIARLSHRNSVCPSVCHTGGSGKSGAS